jgi:hypothetical protein
VLPFTIDLVPSRLIMAGLFTCHCLAAASLLVSQLSVVVTLPLGLLIAVSLCYHSIHYAGLCSRWFIDRLTWSADEDWTVHTADGKERTARLLSSYVHPYIVILSLAAGRFVRYSVVILPDSADSDAIRRLRVCLQTVQRVL